MISKELLSEVIGENITTINIIDNMVIYSNDFDDKPPYDINICELAHKCKVWAKTHGYDIKTDVDGMYEIIDNNDDDNIVIDSYADTEPEAIFKACEWILQQKDNK